MMKSGTLLKASWPCNHGCCQTRRKEKDSIGKAYKGGATSKMQGTRNNLIVGAFVVNAEVERMTDL